MVEPRRWATIDDVLARARERGEPPFVLVLDSLEDPQNVGTLLRSAEACGVHGVLFPTRRSAPISPAAMKASAGAVEHLLLVPLDDLADGLVDLHARGLRLVGADESASLAFREADLRGPLALVVGSEGHGISGHLRRRIDLVGAHPDAGQGRLAQRRGGRFGAAVRGRRPATRSRAPADEVRPDAGRRLVGRRTRRRCIEASPHEPVDADARRLAVRGHAAGRTTDCSGASPPDADSDRPTQCRTSCRRRGPDASGGSTAAAACRRGAGQPDEPGRGRRAGRARPPARRVRTGRDAATLGTAVDRRRTVAHGIARCALLRGCGILPRRRRRSSIGRAAVL